MDTLETPEMRRREYDMMTQMVDRAVELARTGLRVLWVSRRIEDNKAAVDEVSERVYYSMRFARGLERATYEGGGCIEFASVGSTRMWGVSPDALFVDNSLAGDDRLRPIAATLGPGMLFAY